ncbi:MAG TPA: hypothetical protein VFX14_22700 [Methylomirabilota bacterium]|nr:hypothetical protein [Methylomirabilota bacterium]
MTTVRMFALALAIAMLSASAAVAQAPTTGAGKGSATTTPNSGKRPAAATQQLSSPGPSNPAGVTTGGGKVGTKPTTPPPNPASQAKTK